MTTGRRTVVSSSRKTRLSSTPMSILQRVSSFAIWPTEVAPSVSCVLLANAGFTYTGCRDKVACLLCGVEIEGWKQLTRSPREIHRIRSPRCPFIISTSVDQRTSSTEFQTLPTKNPSAETRLLSLTESDLIMPMSSQEMSPGAASNVEPIVNVNQKAPPVRMRTDFTSSALHQSPSGHQAMCSKAGPSSSSSLYVDRRDVSDEESITAVLRTNSKQPFVRWNPDVDALKSERSRLDTFSNWPLIAPVQPSELAASGLVYSGVEDSVQCVFCGGILHHWDFGDVPAAEHRKHFPDCPFLRGDDVGNVPLIDVIETGVVVTSSSVSGKESGLYSADVSGGAANRLDDDVSRVVKTADQCLKKTTGSDFDTSPESEVEVIKLWKEHKRLVEARSCKVCMDSEADTVFLPCGHLVTCRSCASRLKDCPVCRSLIRGTVKAFLT